MNAIVVYYSLEGNTEFAAREIAVQLEAASLKIEPVNPYPAANGAKYFWGTSGSGNAEKCFEKIKRQIGVNKNIQTASLREPAKSLSASDQQRIDNFCKKFMEGI